MVFREKPVLDRVNFQFSQETNCVEGKPNEIETLDVTCLSSWGIDGKDSFFMNIKTGEYGWSVENPKLFFDFMSEIQDTVNFGVENMEIFRENENKITFNNLVKQ